jgi:hypothetical protein
MLIATAHKTFVGTDADGELAHMPYGADTVPRLLRLEKSASDALFTSSPMAGLSMQSTHYGVHFLRQGYFLSAQPGTKLVANRKVAGTWETFGLVPEVALPGFLDCLGPPAQQTARLSKIIRTLNAAQEPIKIYVGSGTVPRRDFLNFDITMAAPAFAVERPAQYFIFPFADMPWDIPDNSVDYIFHEDFIEHIDQLRQIQFLAEAWRVLKLGCFHRVNTPNLLTAMKQHSSFQEGFKGVYTGERGWGHISIFSPLSLKELAELVGYREVIFTTKNHGVSPLCAPDNRPGPDRNELTGNIYADLLK